jgi:hypothetical protein
VVDLTGPRPRRWLSVIVGVAVALLLAGPMTARGDEVSRDEFREAAEPICKKNTEVNERILAGARAEVRHDEFGKAAKKLAAAGRALKGTLGQLKAIPRPTADQAHLAKWFKFIAEEVGYFELSARQLKAGKKTQASKSVVRLTSIADRANAQVIPFEFTYCRLEPSRFT